MLNNIYFYPMDELIAYILQFGNLNNQQIELIRSKATVRELQKENYYWEAGKAVKQVGFLVEGVLRVYYYNNKGDEITRYFIDENHLIVSGHHVDETYTPSEYIAAATPCKLVVFEKNDWKELLDTIIGFTTIVQHILNKHHREKIARRSELIAQDATERYLDFIKKFPNLVNRISLSYVASYLGITQSSLSRIRKNLS